MNKFIDKTLNDALNYIKDSVYSEKYASQQGFLQGIDARLKFLIILTAILTAVYIPEISRSHLNSLFGLFILSFTAGALAAASRIPMAYYLKRVWVFIPIFTTFIAIPALFNVVTPGKPIITILSFGGLNLNITDEGIWRASIFTTEVATSISFSILLILTTRWPSLMKSLNDLRIPKTFAMIMGMAYRYIFLLLSLVSDMLLSKKSRMVGSEGLRESWRSNAPILGALFIKSYDLAENVYLAMLSRGFSGEVKMSSGQACRPLDYFFFSLSILSFAALLMIVHSINLIW